MAGDGDRLLGHCRDGIGFAGNGDKMYRNRWPVGLI